jgi:Phage integrase family
VAAAPRRTSSFLNGCFSSNLGQFCAVAILGALRHEATSRFFEKGLNVMEVASVPGHKALQMLKRYTHLSAGDLVSSLG